MLNNSLWHAKVRESHEKISLQLKLEYIEDTGAVSGICCPVLYELCNRMLCLCSMLLKPSVLKSFNKLFA